MPSGYEPPLSELGEAALHYAQLGFAVLPLIPRTKEPLTKHGVYDASKDLEVVRNWWRKYPNANIGLAAGPINELVVIDIDFDKDKGVDGFETLREWEKEHGEFPETWRSITGRKGCHLLYRTKETFGNNVEIAEGIDIRSAGGFIAVAPSIHPNGNVYAWEYGPDDEIPLAEINDSVRELLRQRKTETISQTLTLPEKIKDGSRNDTLFRLASSLQAKNLSNEAILAALDAENKAKCDPPLPESELRSIVNGVISRYKKGTRQDNAGEAILAAAAAEEITSETAVDIFHDNSANLEYNQRGKLLSTINNFLIIMEKEPAYDRILFNLMTGRPEIQTAKGPRSWTDADESESRNLIEHKYGIHNLAKHQDALRILFRKREYNPLLDLVESIEWDGHSRCESFLPVCMKADDTPYVREVSRLIFAGGIHRLYDPGCKFDAVPVLIGTKQGEGKTTIVEKLALNDRYMATTKNLSGDQKSIEALLGAWIVEIPELAAFRATDVESLKAFTTARVDKFRLPYDRNPSVLPRRCIFIGTTNSTRFLTDRTGNRRFFPVTVHSNGHDIFRDMDGIEIYIQQCWAEARERYKAGTMPAVADPALIDDYLEAQSAAMEDDWRIGLIEKYINDRMSAGDLVCIKELYQYLYPESPTEPKHRDSREIGEIMDSLSQVERVGRQYTSQYGRQRCWKKL